ncbi:hypothetical protein HPB50_014630 [Hyalomma asiaticum]|uniref:Uncharacterized protein n=1 Tax=Hyalomma asiaticum TaxID=266040 RepID=A0ACB7RP69_HYAAI|nr:hypothetical protein HPB50_014630 [Hyalomma asiaticum]
MRYALARLPRRRGAAYNTNAYCPHVVSAHRTMPNCARLQSSPKAPRLRCSKNLSGNVRGKTKVGGFKLGDRSLAGARRCMVPGAFGPQCERGGELHSSRACWSNRRTLLRASYRPPWRRKCHEQADIGRPTTDKSEVRPFASTPKQSTSQGLAPLPNEQARLSEGALGSHLATLDQARRAAVVSGALQDSSMRG